MGKTTDQAKTQAQKNKKEQINKINSYKRKALERCKLITK